VAETWHIRGEYVASCNCRVSPCPCTTAGGDPTEDECNGLTVFSLTDARYGDTDLSGLNAALVTRWRGNVLDGNWDVGLLIDERADERQAEAMETIFTGQAGGTFADLGPLIGTLLGVERASISFESSEGGERASASADGSRVTYTPLKSPSGQRTQVLHGALTFRDRIFPGKTEGGRIEHWDISADTSYGEWSDCEFSGP
jgi:hypothetical protein